MIESFGFGIKGATFGLQTSDTTPESRYGMGV